MSPSPKCKAIVTAMEKKHLSLAQLATSVGTSEQHISDVCSGTVSPTKAEFDAIAKVLDISAPPEHVATVAAA